MPTARERKRQEKHDEREKREEQHDMMTVTQAREALGVSPTKMSDMLKRGELHATADPLDKRIRYIAVEEVNAIKARSRLAASRANEDASASAQAS